MNNIILLPQAQRTNHIEDAVILDEFKAENHFIEANTQQTSYRFQESSLLQHVHLYRWLQGGFESDIY